MGPATNKTKEMYIGTRFHEVIVHVFIIGLNMKICLIVENLFQIRKISFEKKKKFKWSFDLLSDDQMKGFLNCVFEKKNYLYANSII